MDILGNEKIQKALTKNTVLSSSLANFGTSPVVMVGVLYGTMATETRIELAKHISNKMRIHTKNKELPLQLSWSKIHGSSEKSPSVYATTIRTKKEDYTEARDVLTRLRIQQIRIGQGRS